MDLVIQRSFNKQLGGGWRLGLAGVPVEILNPDAPTPPGESRQNPILLTADGTEHRTTPLNGLAATDVWITESFWRYTKDTRTQGIVSTYQQLGGR